MGYAAWPAELVGEEKENNGLIEMFETNTQVELGLALPAEYAESEIYIDQGFYACEKPAGKMTVKSTAESKTKTAVVEVEEEVVEEEEEEVEEEEEEEEDIETRKLAEND